MDIVNSARNQTFYILFLCSAIRLAYEENNRKGIDVLITQKITLKQVLNSFCICLG